VGSCIDAGGWASARAPGVLNPLPDADVARPRVEDRWFMPPIAGIEPK
jgi:hypothetical protein